MSILNVEHVTHGFGARQILNDASFRLLNGEHVGLVGANGEGKSTFLNIIMGKLQPDEGKVEWGRHITTGYLDQYSTLEKGMTIRDVLRSAFDHLAELETEMLGLYDKMSDCSEEEMNELMEEVGEIQSILDYSGYYTIDAKISEYANGLGLNEIGLDRDVSELSGGQRAKALLAKVLLENPMILILDEPTVGLDPNQIIEIRSLIKKLGKRHTVILSSHILPEIQAVCDRIIIINKGEVAADGTANDIAKNITNEHKMTLRIEGPTHTAADKAEIAAALRKVTGVSYVRADMEREKGIYDYDIETDGKTDVRRDINKLCAENDWNILMLQLSDLTLEDIFLKITMGEENSIAAKDPSKKKSSPKLDLKIEDGELRASEVTDEAPEEAEKPAETDLKNEGGEE